MAPKKSARRQAQKEACIMNCLPRELIDEVLFKLPASCLLRCMSVCKMWRSIIRDSKFAAAHLRHAPSCALLFCPQGSISGELYPSDAIIFDEAWSPSTRAVPVVGPDDLICGSCNGLLCLYTPTSTIKIANPATGELVHLLKPTKNLKDDHFSLYRFGFHPVTKEYKVIHFFHDKYPYTEGSFNVIQVYTLGDEKWKDVATPEALGLNCVKNSGVVIVDGTMYWLIEDRENSWQHIVMSFDLGEETFAQIRLPEVDLEYWPFGGRHYWISEIYGRVCVSTAQSISHLDRVLFGKLQIWSLNSKVDQRWSQNYSILLPSVYIRGLPFVHRDKILIQGSDSNLYSYELHGKNFEIELSKMVKLLDLRPRGEDDMQLYVCVKSVVPLDIYSKAATVRRPKLRGWGLKKWKVWEHELFELEKLWSTMHQLEHDMLARSQLLKERIKMIWQRLPDEAIQQHVSTKIDRMLRLLPDYPVQDMSCMGVQHPRPVQRPNWVEKMRSMETLRACVDGLKDRVTALLQAHEDIVGALESYALPSCQGKQQAQ